MELQTRIQEIIDRIGISQKELAQRTGLRPTTISELCNNVRSTINKKHIGKIAESLGIVDVKDLLILRKK